MTRAQLLEIIIRELAHLAHELACTLDFDESTPAEGDDTADTADEDQEIDDATAEDEEQAQLDQDDEPEAVAPIAGRRAPRPRRDPKPRPVKLEREIAADSAGDGQDIGGGERIPADGTTLALIVDVLTERAPSWCSVAGITEVLADRRPGGSNEHLGVLVGKILFRQRQELTFSIPGLEVRQHDKRWEYRIRRRTEVPR